LFTELLFAVVIPQVNDLKIAHRKTMADKEQEMNSKLIDQEFSHKRKVAGAPII
jgi:hypothetical protein